MMEDYTQFDWKEYGTCTDVQLTCEGQKQLNGESDLVLQKWYWRNWKIQNKCVKHPTPCSTKTGVKLRYEVFTIKRK